MPPKNHITSLLSTKRDPPPGITEGQAKVKNEQKRPKTPIIYHSLRKMQEGMRLFLNRMQLKVDFGVFLIVTGELVDEVSDRILLPVRENFEMTDEFHEIR